MHDNCLDGSPPISGYPGGEGSSVSLIMTEVRAIRFGSRWSARVGNDWMWRRPRGKRTTRLAVWLSAKSTASTSIIIAASPLWHLFARSEMHPAYLTTKRANTRYLGKKSGPGKRASSWTFPGVRVSSFCLNLNCESFPFLFWIVHLGITLVLSYDYLTEGLKNVCFYLPYFPQNLC